jgi:hypothetical protein
MPGCLFRRISVIFSSFSPVDDIGETHRPGIHVDYLCRKTIIPTKTFDPGRTVVGYAGREPVRVGVPPLFSITIQDIVP